MSRFTDLFQEPTPDPESIPTPEVVEVEEVKVAKTSEPAKKKFTMD
ncbi:MAG: hypothetical protein ACKO96_19455 [Flammeovirgaceae bacterium]